MMLTSSQAARRCDRERPDDGARRSGRDADDSDAGVGAQREAAGRQYCGCLLGLRLRIAGVAVLPVVADLDIAVLAGRGSNHAVERASLPAHLSSQSRQRRGSTLPRDAGRAWAGILVAEPLHGLWLQGAILWFVAIPLLVAVRAARPAALTAVDGLGVVLFAVGFGVEVVGDYQLERFKAEPSNRGGVLDRGLWRYTRHPNYFGDATLWWGVYAIAGATPRGWLTVLSPALMSFVLMRVSGVTLLEDGLKASKPGYHAYITRTPALFPRFPRVPR
jgi:protein-S-isoprenylcysteine O-methyltransferase Ste14